MAAVTAVSRPSSGGLLGEGSLGDTGLAQRSNLVCRRAALEVLSTCGTAATTAVPTQPRLHRTSTLALGEEAPSRASHRTSRSCHVRAVRQAFEEGAGSGRLRDYIPNAWTLEARQRPVLRRAATVQGCTDLLSRNSFTVVPVSKDQLVLPVGLTRSSPTALSSERRTKVISPTQTQAPGSVLVDIVAPASTSTPRLAAAAAAAVVEADPFALNDDSSNSDPFGLGNHDHAEAPKALLQTAEVLEGGSTSSEITENSGDLPLKLDISAGSEQSESPVAEPIRKKGRITEGLRLPLPPRRGVESLDEDPHATPKAGGASGNAPLLPLRMPGATNLGPGNANNKKVTTGRVLPARLQQLDDQTVMPKEIYNGMLKLGDAARGRLGRGQHRLAFAGTDGSQVLRLASATVA